MRHVVINTSTGYVENAIMLDKDNTWPVPAGHIIIEHATAGPGWKYQDGCFIEPTDETTAQDETPA